LDPGAEDRDEEMICGAVSEHLPEKGAENSAGPFEMGGNPLWERVSFSEHLDGNSGFSGSLPGARNGTADRTDALRSSRIIFSCQRTSRTSIKNIEEYIRSPEKNRSAEIRPSSRHKVHNDFPAAEPGFETRGAGVIAAGDFSAMAHVSRGSSASSPRSVGAASRPLEASLTMRWSGSSSRPGRPNTCIRCWASLVIP